MEARLKLQNTKLKKSGKNTYAGYEYFELADFLPAVQTIFNDLGLCGVVSYAQDVATLTIVDTDDCSVIEIKSPMAEANLKGCHPIQNLGAVETYTRRYLWVTAMEIVEHDALDASEPVKEEKPKMPELKSVQLSDFDEESQQFLKDTAIEMIAAVEQGAPVDAYNLSLTLTNDEKLAIWTLLDSKTRTALKKYSQELQRKAA